MLSMYWSNDYFDKFITLTCDQHQTPELSDFKSLLVKFKIRMNCFYKPYKKNRITLENVSDVVIQEIDLSLHSYPQLRYLQDQRKQNKTSTLAMCYIIIDIDTLAMCYCIERCLIQWRYMCYWDVMTRFKHHSSAQRQNLQTANACYYSTTKYLKLCSLLQSIALKFGFTGWQNDVHRIKRLSAYCFDLVVHVQT